MNFETNIVPWIDEIQNYLKDSSKKTSDIKKVLKSADLENLSYADKARLYKMFDPKCEITEELFKRQLDLYFSLLESKSTNIRIPVFADYVEWIYSQDVSKMRDRTFDILTSRLLKTKATDLPKPITMFMDSLSDVFHGDIDKYSNARLGTLVNILNGLDIEYSSLPQSCKEFVTAMFNACSVKSEIADKNKNRMRQLFIAEPRLYYNFFNKAFSGTGAYETWIDEPAKKITVQNMINYANFQELVLANSRKPLHYDAFVTYAQELNLPKFPPYDKSLNTYSRFYLKEPREYKDYAKKLGSVFVGLVQDEMSRVEKLYDDGIVKHDDLYAFAITQNAKKRAREINPYDSKNVFLSQYANYMIELVHLDELTGQSKSNIYFVKKTDETTQRQVAASKPETVSSGRPEGYGYFEQKAATSKSRVPGQLSLFGGYEGSPYYPTEKSSTVEDKIELGTCTVADLPELYEMYNKSISEGKTNYELEQMIVELEDRQKEGKGFGEKE